MHPGGDMQRTAASISLLVCKAKAELVSPSLVYLAFFLFRKQSRRGGLERAACDLLIHLHELVRAALEQLAGCAGALALKSARKCSAGILSTIWRLSTAKRADSRSEVRGQRSGQGRACLSLILQRGRVQRCQREIW